MMKPLLRNLIAIALFLPFVLNAQDFFRSSENKLYWKNRKPAEGYWQQDIHYNIKAAINEKTDIIDGIEELTYYNNSPDELSFVYFHLYQNAFQPDSYLDDLQKANKVKPVYGKYEKTKQGTTVDKITIDGKEVKTELDNTILKVYLNEPLKSGSSVKFNINFKTYFDKGSTRRRMKIINVGGNTHYDGVHWYPRISVYDRKFGWTTDQHLGKEFYGDFGSYDVELTFANNYVLDATGVLLNKDEVLPDSLRKKLDIKNFANKKLFEKASIVIQPNGTTKTWKFHADNVHDFAFTADPTYRIGEAEWNGIKCIALAQESHAARWQNAADYTAKIIKTYSEDIGMYGYPKMIVADAEDGMEYPMLTLDGGLDPGYRSLLCHEVGHNWFFGMVGNNETYRAALDEGFTQFLTAWCFEKLEGLIDQPIRDSSFWAGYINNYSEGQPIRYKRAYQGYLLDAIRNEDMPLNTHSDQFNGALAHGGGYRHVYYKTATMLYNLQYTLGDELFLKAMQHYFDQWKFAHPYFEDFRNSIIQYTHVDLNWFFDQWMETTKNIDYKVECIKKGSAPDEYIIKIKRKGQMQMPIDFTVTAKDGKQFNYHIPNDWFVKKTTATVLPRWIGWDNLKPCYEAKVTIPSGIENVQIDTTNRLADVNLLDNSKKTPLSLSFDSRINNAPKWTIYDIKARPDLWYNNFDGLKFGIHFQGNYMNYKHILDASFWFNSGLLQKDLPAGTPVNAFDNMSYSLNYRTGIAKFGTGTFVNISSKSLDGLLANAAGLDKTVGNNSFYINFKSMYRRNQSDLEYLLYPKEWLSNRFNNTLNFGLEHRYYYFKGSGYINLGLRSSSIGSDYNYANLALNVVNRNLLGKFELNTRTFAQYGKGLSADESALFLAGANPEELMDNKFTRSRGFIDNSWLDYGATTNHFQQGGGLNLRGYAGYLAPATVKGETRFTYKGNSGASISAELEFDRFFKFRPKFFRTWLKLDTYVFGDAGFINTNYTTERFSLSPLRADAGLGTALTIKKWGPLQNARPLTIRFDMPFWLNTPPYENPDYVKMRWIVGINRTF